LIVFKISCNLVIIWWSIKDHKSITIVNYIKFWWSSMSYQTINNMHKFETLSIYKFENIYIIFFLFLRIFFKFIWIIIVKIIKITHWQVIFPYSESSHLHNFMKFQLYFISHQERLVNHKIWTINFISA
jgi:hypothetical protein